MRRTRHRLSVLLLLIGLPIGCGGAVRETHYNRGVRLQREGRLPAAAREYRHAIEEDEKDALALYNLGTVYQAIGKREKARAAYRKALEIRDDPRAHINLASILEDEGKVEAALGRLDRAVKADEESAYPICYRGFFHERRGEIEKAFADYRAGIEREPEEAFGHLRLGKLLWKTGSKEEALRSLVEAVRLDSSGAVAWKAVGDLSREMGEAAGAIRAFERLSTLEPDVAEHRIALGELYLEVGKPDRAAAALWRARTISPGDRRIGLRLLEAYQALLSGEVDAAIETGEDAKELESLVERLARVRDRILSATSEEGGDRLDPPPPGVPRPK